MNRRLLGIDSMRFIACVAVIFLHCFPATGPLKIVVDQAARFAVPFFFVASGYFLAAKLIKQDQPLVYLRYTQKILLLYSVWSLIYFLDPPLTGNVLAVYQDRFHRFMQLPWEERWLVGVSGHFWFFISLTLTVWTFMLFRLRYLTYFLGLAIVLYVIGVLGKAYQDTPFGLSLGINTRNFIFFSSLPFALGVIIRVKQWQPSARIAVSITLLGYLLHFTEAEILRTFYGVTLQDYGFSTFLMGVGVFSMARQGLSSLEKPRLAYLGQFTLGVYAIHILVAQRLHVLYVGPLVEVWFIVWPVLVLLFSLLTVQLFRQVKMLREIV
jgi:surface polysaccharide O-acyltransferase-like enzyme